MQFDFFGPFRSYGERTKKVQREQKEKREKQLEKRKKWLYGDKQPSILNPVPTYRILKLLSEGAELGFQIGAFGAKQEGRIAGGSMMDLYTPEIREYERTALVGLGGMRI